MGQNGHDEAASTRQTARERLERRITALDEIIGMCHEAIASAPTPVIQSAWGQAFNLLQAQLEFYRRKHHDLTGGIVVVAPGVLKVPG